MVDRFRRFLWGYYHGKVDFPTSGPALVFAYCLIGKFVVTSPRIRKKNWGNTKIITPPWSKTCNFQNNSGGRFERPTYPPCSPVKYLKSVKPPIYPRVGNQGGTRGEPGVGCQQIYHFGCRGRRNFALNVASQVGAIYG